MAIQVSIISNTPTYFEIPYPTDDSYRGDNQQLSHEEFKALLDELADISMKFTRSDVLPLSDYAVSREGIYAGNPKL